MRKLFSLLCLAAALGPPLAHTQSRTSGTIPSSPGTGCVSINVDAFSTVGIQVTGTWSGTLQPEISIQGQAGQNAQVTPSTSTTAQSTITANGVYRASVAGGSTFLLCGSTVASGTASVYLNATIASASVPGGVNGSSFPIVAPQQTQSGGSLAPTGIGQVVANQDWWSIGPITPTVTASQTGGTLLSGHSMCLRTVFNNGAGQTLPGGEICSSYGAMSGSTCVSGGACSVTVTAPTLPAGYSGYSVYDCDYASTSCSGSELKQAASAACVNITGNCVIGTAGAGAALPTTNTAYIYPSPLGTNVCSPGTNPFIFASDGMNFYPYVGVDGANTGSNPPAPYNKLTFCRPVWFNDSSTDPPLGRNALVLMNHIQNGTITNAGNQDRGLQIFTTNCLPTGSCADSSTHYALEGIQVEQDVNGTPTINGSPDGEVTSMSAQLAFYPTANVTSTSYGSNAGRFTNFREAGAAVDTQGMTGIYSIFQNNSTTTGSSLFAAGLKAACLNTAAASNIFCSAVTLVVPNTANQFTGQFGIYFPLVPSWTPRAGTDWFIRNDNAADSQMGGKVYTSAIIADLQGFPITASATVTGSLATAQATINAPFSISCTGGGSQYTYAFVGVDANGGQVVSSTNNSAATCVNPLTSGNPATVAYASGLSAANALNLAQFARIDVYRTAGPMAAGKIGSLTCTFGGNLSTCANFSDTGLAAGSALPTGNTTGSIKAPLYETTTNCAATGTAASPSVASCTAAPAGSFSCATNASGATCVVNTTAVTANSEIFVEARLDTNTGTRLGVTCMAAYAGGNPVVSAVSAGTSFTINVGTITTNPACFSYQIVN